MKVDDGWESAYDGDFTQGANNGTYPLVVSYASSPPAAVYYSKPQPKTSPIGTMLDSCFRQVEFAGVLKGTDTRVPRPDELVDFMLSPSASRPTSRCRCSCSRCATVRRCRRAVHEVRRGGAAAADVAGRGDRRAPGRRGSSSGPTPCCGDHPSPCARAGASRSRWCRSRSSPCSSSTRWSTIVGRGLAPDWHARPRSARRGASRTPSLRHIAWFTVWQATLSTVLTLAGGAAGRVRARALRVPRPPARARPRDRALRAADRGRGHGVHRAPRHGGPLAGPRARPDGLGDPGRPRVLQLRGRRAHGRRPLVAPRPAPRRRRGCSGRAGGARSGRSPSRAATGDRGRGGRRVPLHLHVVRRDPDPRRPAHRHARDRDLPPDRAAAQPAARCRAHRGATGRDRRCCSCVTGWIEGRQRRHARGCAPPTRPRAGRGRARSARSSRPTSR